MSLASLSNNSDFPIGPITLALVVIALLILMGALIVIAKRYRRCPSNRILVVYGKISGGEAAKCLHGGGTFVWPMIQDYAYLSLEPITIDIELTNALSKNNIRVNVPSTFTIGIETQPQIMTNAAERLLGLMEEDIKLQARDIILGQMRLVIAMLTIEEINQDREKFLDLVNKNVNFELNKIGLGMINVNIRDIVDESGYIQALGQKAAAEAINQAKVEVAEAERGGAIGQASAKREMDVKVSEQNAQNLAGRKQAERDQRIRVASLEAEGITGEAESRRLQEIALAEQAALTEQGRKNAESEQRIKIATYEANAVEGENTSKATIAASRAILAEKEADARRKGEVALANAQRDILLAEREREQAKLEKEQLVQQLVEQKKIEIEAEAFAERTRRIARGDADATLARYTAEAQGTQKVLEAKAMGYQRLLEVCSSRPDIAPALLLIEKLPELVAEQVKAIQNLKIDKITVWDGGGNSGGGAGDGPSSGTTSHFLRSLMSSLPPMHELAQQAGIELPNVLGKVQPTTSTPGETNGAPSESDKGKKSERPVA